MLTFRYRVRACTTSRGEASFFVGVPRVELKEFMAALEGKVFTPDSFLAVLREIQDLNERDARLSELYAQTSLEKLQVEIGNEKETKESAQAPPKEDLFLKLLQTSITRFGLLAVVGFFVSILVSLYRYNVRLAAFYNARADLLRLSDISVTISDFGLLATALTPTLEFGKSPQLPIGQLVELVKTAKESAK